MSFSTLLQNVYRGVPGITEITSTKPGLTAGIFAITHGNEPVGLHVFDSVVNQIPNILENGKVLLIAVNLKAYELYCSHKSDQYRYVDHNCNRISNIPSLEHSYEFQRLKALQPILEEIDIALDLHSTTTGGCTLGICDTTLTSQAQVFMTTNNILVDDISQTGALIGLLLRQGKHAYGIECGQHLDPKSIDVGVHNVTNFLRYYKLIAGDTTSSYVKPMYRFSEEIIPCTKDFMFTKTFLPFEKILPDQLYARDKNVEYKNISQSRYIGLLGNTIIPGDGIGFLFEKLL